MNKFDDAYLVGLHVGIQKNAIPIVDSFRAFAPGNEMTTGVGLGAIGGALGGAALGGIGSAAFGDREDEEGERRGIFKRIFSGAGKGALAGLAGGALVGGTVLPGHIPRIGKILETAEVKRRAAEMGAPDSILGLAENDDARAAMITASGEKPIARMNMRELWGEIRKRF